jgi:FolB domain-containing protein
MARRKSPAGGDWIHLRKLKVRGVLGVHPAERRKPRKVELDLALECDVRRAAKSDQLADTLNYELIESDVIAIAKTGHFRLIETLAERVAEVCLKHPQVRGVRVVVDKPGALPHTRSVAVEIVRRK